VYSLIIKFIAPFETGLNLHSYQTLANSDLYRKFWSKVSKGMMNTFPNIVFLHSSIDKTKQKFETIKHDSTSLAFELLMVKDEQLNPFFIQSLEAFKENQKFIALTERLVYIESCCKIYDNTIGVVEFDFELSYSEEEILPILDELQKFSNELMEDVLKRVYLNLLSPVFSRLQLLDRDKKYIHSIELKTDEDICPLWVNRSLFVSEQNELILQTLAEKWLALSTENLNACITELMTSGIYLGWGHNLFLEKTDLLKSKQAVDALHLCQYYNAVFDNLDNKLSTIIGETFLHHKVNKRTKLLNKKLNDILANTKLLLLQMNETQFNLQGFKQYYFLDLVEKWHLEKLKANLENKMQFCQEKVQEIYQQQTKKNQLITEIILFGIGGIALVDFFSSISQYAFTILTSTKTINYEYINIPGMLDLATHITPNGMIWSGFIFLFIIFALYSLFQSRSR
jgi:hypothetical protein